MTFCEKKKKKQKKKKQKKNELTTITQKLIIRNGISCNLNTCTYVAKYKQNEAIIENVTKLSKHCNDKHVRKKTI